MYHYVRPDSDEYPHFNSLSVTNFAKQLDYFEKKYGLVSREDYQRSIETGENVDGVVLTFDDGFKDHFKYVLPELQKRGLWGLFYLSTNMYTSEHKKLLGVHRVHYLKGKYGSKKILKDLLEITEKHMLDEEKISEFDQEIYKFSDYGSDEKELRRMLNYFISYKYRDELLDQLMDKYFDEEKMCEEVYLSIEDIKKLHDAGNIIGSHTINHYVLSRLSREEQYIEIKQSFEFIESLVEIPKRSFCYPYGYKASYNEDTLNILEELNVNDAVVFDNKVHEGAITPFELSRIDCNQFLSI
jgi:peptidoglycan/xylan/chitin deacetylase (PgdA/CDA1 family)